MNLLLTLHKKIASKNKKKTGWMAVVVSNVPTQAANASQFIPSPVCTNVIYG